ncbi:MAG: hypothetical protein HPPSJP_1980 [Candidatus Hepatoplasma scabrum]|nr:MAG: hypothetical protein HPPSJP_1980 [Candidatus Hepatoplasma sp.]
MEELYFKEKISILKYLQNEKFLTLQDLIKRKFISSGKIKERENFFRKKGFSEEGIKNGIWNYFIERLQKTSDLRNKISHLDNLIIKKNDSEDLLNYFYGQFDLLRNDYTIEIFYKIKLIFLKNNLISRNDILRNHYEDFFAFKMKKNKNNKNEQFLKERIVQDKHTNLSLNSHN